MYVCMYVLYVCTGCTVSVCMYVCMYIVYMMYVCMYVLYVCMYVCMYSILQYNLHSTAIIIQVYWYAGTWHLYSNITGITVWTYSYWTSSLQSTVTGTVVYSHRYNCIVVWHTVWLYVLFEPDCFIQEAHQSVLQYSTSILEY